MSVEKPDKAVTCRVVLWHAVVGEAGEIIEEKERSIDDRWRVPFGGFATIKKLARGVRSGTSRPHFLFPPPLSMVPRCLAPKLTVTNNLILCYSAFV